MKSIFVSKTFWFNIISLIVATLALPEFVALIPSEYLPFIALVMGFGNLVLRTITKEPVTLKSK